MSYAPGDLLEVRAYLMARAGLPAVSLGIVGDSAHNGGYHCGRDRITTADYSWAESTRDRANASAAASALDIGLFDVTVGGRRVTLRSFSLAVVDACRRGDPRARDIREVIYSPDGITVRRWDRLGVRSTGDSSHRTHTHLSFFRDSEGRRNRPDNVLGLFRSIFEGDGVDLTTPVPGTSSFDRAADRNVGEVLGDVFNAVMGASRDPIAGGGWTDDGLWPQSVLTEIRNGIRELAARPAGTVSDAQAEEIGARVLAAIDATLDARVEAAIRRTLGSLDTVAG